jgi:hypothetical protein
MTTYAEKPQSKEVVRLTGTITNYRCTRASASFVFGENNQYQFGAIAVAAALAGMGGQAASIIGAASDMEESADFLEFDLDGNHVEGWVWRSPFKDGDTVVVAAERWGEQYEAYGVARPSDRTIALYPHCSRGKRRHIKNAVKWWLIWNACIFGPLITWEWLERGNLEILLQPAIAWFNAVMVAFFILMFTSLARQYMPFVRVAQRVFVVLGLPDAENIDLVKSSNRQRTNRDPAEFGTFYFRY